MRYEIEGKLLSDIGDAIREKTGKSELILPGDMPGEILSIKAESGGRSSISHALVLDNANNVSGNMSNTINFEDIQKNDRYGFLFYFNDNQRTNIKIGDILYNSDSISFYSAGTLTACAIVGETDSFDITLNGGDGGNIGCTFIAIPGSFSNFYKSTATSSFISSSIDADLSEAYLLLIFTAARDIAQANVSVDGEDIFLNRYTYRYGTSIFTFAKKLSNLHAGDMVTVSFDFNDTGSFITLAAMGILGNT